jgi:hypothetical protein
MNQTIERKVRKLLNLPARATTDERGGVGGFEAFGGGFGGAC